jgi:hypothetical protein
MPYLHYNKRLMVIFVYLMYMVNVTNNVYS